jgi:hypothetical protein
MLEVCGEVAACLRQFDASSRRYGISRQFKVPSRCHDISKTVQSSFKPIQTPSRHSRRFKPSSRYLKASQRHLKFSNSVSRPQSIQNRSESFHFPLPLPHNLISPAISLPNLRQCLIMFLDVLDAFLIRTYCAHFIFLLFLQR